MRMFFCALKRRGALGEEEVETLRSRIVESAAIGDHLTWCEVHRPTRETMVVGISNEPQGAVTTGDRWFWPCGLFWAVDRLADIDPGPGFADAISRLPGRFSAVMIRGSTFAMGTPATRVDSVFEAANDDYTFFGNQASVLSVLRDGQLRYAPEQLVSFIGAGFFASDQTPYEGVTALPPLTTVYYDGTGVRRSRTELADLKADARARGDILEACAGALTAALHPLVASSEPVQLGLAGGKDSRLLLAALIHAGVRPRCHTDAKGESNRADVWVAREVAARAGVDHTIVDVSRADASAPTGKRFDLIASAATTLRNSDGMMSAFTPLRGDSSVHRPQLSLWGHGGECLRGGWAENRARPTADHVARFFRDRFEGFPVFARAAQERQQAFAAGWIAAQLARCGPAETLDIAYLYFRIGRWVAAGSRGAASKVLPLLDNAVSREVLAIDVPHKRSHRLHRELIARHLPAVGDLPLANKFWSDTPPAERERLRARYPEAYSEEKPAGGRPARSFADRMLDLFRRRPVAGLAPPVLDHIRHYLVRDGRLDLLRDVVDPDRMRGFLRRPDPALDAKRLLLGAYSAAVLLSENWRGPRPPSRPIAVER